MVVQVVGCVLPCAAYGCCLCIPLWDWLDDHLPTSFLPFLSFLSLYTAYTGRRPFHHTLTCSLRTLCLSNNCSAVLRGATPLPADVGAAGTVEVIGTSFFIRLPIHPPTHHHSCF